MATPPVDASEVLVRQVGAGGDPIYFDPNRPPPIHFSLFLPNKADLDGLSVLRPAHRTEIWCAYRVEQPEQRYRLARLGANVLRAIALDVGFADWTLRIDPDELDRQFGEPHAHCLVVEVNIREYQGTTKNRIKEWARAVAKSVSLADVVGPFEPPTDATPYRP